MRAVCGLLVVVACGDNWVPAQPDAPSSLPYQPLAIGDVWSYRLTGPLGDVASNRLTTVIDRRDVGGIHAGKTALFVHVEKLDSEKDVYEDTIGDLTVRYRSEFYTLQAGQYLVDEEEPYRLKLDETTEHLVPGISYTAKWDEISTPAGSASQTSARSETWVVVSADESITVPAGTFTTLHLRRENVSSPGKFNDYWYAPGVGKVRETGGDQLEELESYMPGPR